MESVKIKSIKKLKKSHDKYDLEVKKNHNFFANNMLVHNCRALIIIDALGNVKINSRSGKPFTTLSKLEVAIKELNLTNTVLDGEVCILDQDGNENFQDIIKEIKRKDHTIENPFYYIFDMLTIEEFANKESTRKLRDRLTNAALTINPTNNKYYGILPQYLGNDKVLTDMIKTAKDNDWEGLMLRKDAPYKGKRSNDVLKVKAFKDAEYIIIDTENSINRVIVDGHEVDEIMLKNIIIEHKGNRVQVGSGFNHEERRLYYKEPERIVGKIATVQYFSESKDVNGNYSLRFPVIKTIYEQERDI